MTRRFPHHPSRLAFLAASALALGLAAASPAVAQETPAGDAAAPAAAPAGDSEKPKSGYWRGRHRLSLVAGYHLGGTVRDAGILASPLTGQPGSQAYPAKTPLSVDLADSPTFGLRYAWFGAEKWGVEAGITGVSSNLEDPNADLADDAARLTQTTLSARQQQLLLDRLAAHTMDHDLQATFFDVGMLHVFNPKKRWPIEIGGGIGWAFSSMDGPVAYERLVTSDIVRPGDLATVANEVLDPPPPFGQCLADNDPCIELKAQDGMTWHAYMEVGYAFTPNVQLRFGGRVRFVEQLVDPGDSQVMRELTIGVAWLFGGK